MILFYFFIVTSGHLQPGEDAIEPMALFVVPVVINLAYTGGWIVELVMRYIFRITSMKIGPVLLRLGIIFSLFVVSIPPVVWCGVCLYDKLK